MAQHRIQLKQIDFGNGEYYSRAVKVLSGNGFNWNQTGHVWERDRDGSKISDQQLERICTQWPQFAEVLMSAVVGGLSPIDCFFTVQEDKINHEVRAVFRLQKTVLDKLAEV